MIALCAKGCDHPVPIVEIAEARGIALHVLEQIFASLRRAGILKSQRGVRGGYSFARSAADVTVLDVVECIDGPLVSTGEALPRGECVWEDARQVLADHLRATTIADLSEREARIAGTIMFHI